MMRHIPGCVKIENENENYRLLSAVGVAHLNLQVYPLKLVGESEEGDSHF